MFRTVYANASDIALCQRCPALFGYKIHMHEKNAWQVGIKGSGYYYGSMFHRNIARPFFEAAANPEHHLHAEAVRAVSGNRADLERFMRERIFMPFMEQHSGEYSQGQIMAAARGVKVWEDAMSDFFAEIPSLSRHPEGAVRAVFLRPEQKLQAKYDFPNEGSLVVTGCYDALMFNPDGVEARLFEFKGYAKSDIAVPLSQSLIYAWLIWEYAGIMPSLEIIYLDDEDRKPVVFDSVSVNRMIDAGLPGLFYSAFNTITLRRMPEIMRDKNLCKVCRFSNTCASDWGAKFGKRSGASDSAGPFRKRAGASLVNVCVFFLAATMIMAQVFFFSTTSTENLAEETKATARRFSMDRKLELAFTKLKDESNHITSAPVETPIAFADDVGITDAGIIADNFVGFHRGTRVYSDDVNQVYIYNLNYTLLSVDYAAHETSANYWDAVPIPQRIFPPMSADRFLVRILSPRQGLGKKLMYQVLVSRDSSVIPYKITPLTFQEVWYE
ncbi:MAG: hypothetical protein IJU26_00550 [Synergistaceae bacterium]|nr:hypothetical protein [Synergistaceae bacterium]